MPKSRVAIASLAFLVAIRQVNILERASREMTRFVRRLDPDAITDGTPISHLHGTWVEVVSGKFVYRVDTAGNQTIRPLSLIDVLSKQPTTPRPLIDLKARPTKAQLASLETKARQLKSAIFPDDPHALSALLVKREVLLSQKSASAVNRTDFRFLVRLSTDVYGGPEYFQVFFDPSLQPVRIDTNIPSEGLSDLKQALLKVGRTGRSEPGALAALGNLRFGNFYAKGEHRFEITGRSFIGESFLDRALTGNPFQGDHFDVSHTEFVNVGAYRRSSDYKYWSCTWWEKFGRVGAARGNFDAASDTWQNPNVQPFFKSLGDYSFVRGEPNETKKLRLSDGNEYEFPFAVDQVMEQTFARDLEGCTIAAVETHGGPINNMLNFSRGKDTWFCLGPSDSRMGGGSLRHLLLCGCSSMTLFRDKNSYSPLLKEFLPGMFARGVRTICGFDGDAVGLDRGGWEFFGQYNEGDSITDAWALSNIGECPKNSPVTVAYGSTVEEARQTLLDGRFSTARAGTQASCASVWVNVIGDDSVRDDLYAFPNDEGRIERWSQGFGGLQIDRELDGGPLRIGKQSFSHGLGTHSVSQIVIELPIGAKRVSGKVGVTPSPSGKGSIIARIRANDHILFMSDVLRSGDEALPFSVDVTGSRKVTLEIGDANDGGESDHANWVNLTWSK